MNDLFICQCETKFSIENNVLYVGRCDHKHGLNLFTISDVAHNCDLESIVSKLNADEQNLAEIKAQAIEEAVELFSVSYLPDNKYCESDRLLRWAKQLRGGIG